MRLVNHSTGEVVRGRCRATNLCDYCAKLAAVENAELLALDAMEYAPTLWVVLTTRSGSVDPKRFYKSREQVWRAVRRRWPEAEYAFIVEFTTGYGPRAGGLRRPHWNLLVKGVPVADLEAFGEVVRRVWCEREDAVPEAQYVGEIAEAGGLMRYLALHFQKESQAPPKGWRGHRFRASNGYLVRPASVLREEAKRSLRVKRLIHRGVDAETVELELAVQAETVWSLVHVNPSTVDLRGGERDGSSTRLHDARVRVAGALPGLWGGGGRAVPEPAGRSSVASSATYGGGRSGTTALRPARVEVRADDG
jgi:hypothetical protein